MKLYGQLFTSNLELLMEESGLTETEIRNSRKELAVDCRIILIMIAKEYKVTDAKIEEFSGFTKQQIQRAKAQFKDRIRYLDVSVMMEKVRKRTADNIENYRK